VLRPRKMDRGIATVQYAALLLVIGAIVGGMAAADIPARAQSGAVAAVCKIFSSGNCARRTDTPDARTAGQGKNDCKAFCPTENNPIHPSDPVTAATKGGYVAMGDSYSSGEGAADQYLGDSGQTGCHRAPGAYSQGITGDFHFQDGASFVACSGATTGTIETGEHGEGSQLDALSPKTTLVTVSAGGNDVQFADIMTKCILDPHFSFSDLWPGNAPAPDRCQAQRESMDANMNALFGHPPGGGPSKYEQFLETVHQRAPNARIVVVGYPRLFPEPPTDGYATINKDDQRFLNDMADRLNGQIRQAVADEDKQHYGNGQQQMGSFEFVDNTDTFKGHELTTDDPWINGVRLCAGLGLPSSTQNCKSGKLLPSANTSSFHPTAQGQHAFEEAVRKQIQNGPNRTLYDP
jgi:lysophospholipase L1-like esterase